MARWWWYVVLGAVAVLSVCASLILPVEPWLKQTLALPFVGALFAALFQILRDSNSAKHEQFRQERDHAFTVAATSHMSETLFNKQIEFADAYIAALQELLGKIFAEGPHKDIARWLEPIHAIRRRYRLWLTSQMTAGLDQLEMDLMEMGSAMIGADRDFQRWERAHNLFVDILGLEGNTSDQKAKSFNVAIDHLQAVLGIAELTKRRDRLLASDANN